MARYTAKSASDRTDDWPFWFVADSVGINVTRQLVPEIAGYMPFLPRSLAVVVAERANQGDDD